MGMESWVFRIRRTGRGVVKRKKNEFGIERGGVLGIQNDNSALGGGTNKISSGPYHFFLKMEQSLHKVSGKSLASSSGIQSRAVV